MWMNNGGPIQIVVIMKLMARMSAKKWSYFRMELIDSAVEWIQQCERSGIDKLPAQYVKR